MVKAKVKTGNNSVAFISVAIYRLWVLCHGGKEVKIDVAVLWHMLDVVCPSNKMEGNRRNLKPGGKWEAGCLKMRGTK